MGFRSNFITESMTGIKIPTWFFEKYPDYKYQNNQDDEKVFAIAQLWESKFYGVLEEDERLLDIQKVVKEVNLNKLVLILLHECGGITRVQITADKIIASEPEGWNVVEGVEHSYCYGCSDIN